MATALLTAPPAYDLAPLASLLLVGALLALGPVLWIWFHNRHTTPLKRVQALRLLTLFLTFDLVLFGAFTRLTDSGLGCPDWPGCYGKPSPVGASTAIALAQTAMPSGPVTQAKAWIEMLHRYLATGVGALIVFLTALAWRDWRSQGKLRAADPLLIHPGWASLTLVWVCVQGAFGALTVTMKLFPAIVTLHLLGAVGLLVLLCLQVVWGAGVTAPKRPLSAGLWRLLVWTFALLIVQVALGGWVSANYAVLACNDFPTCQGRWWPQMDFAQGFELWRALGLTAAGEHISFAALTAIHYTHRLAAYVVLTLLIALAWQLNRVKDCRTQSRVLAALIGLQLATGLSNVVMGWPLIAALLHTGGAGALVLTLTWTLARMHPPAAPGKGPVPGRLNTGRLA